MNTVSPTGDASADDRERLVAYLDGELAETEKEVLEQKLTEDLVLRRELESIDRAWQLLDELPRSRMDQSFTASTIEMIATKAAEDVVAGPWGVLRRHKVRILGAAAAVAAVVIGYLTVWAVPNPNENLIRDYDLLRHYDEYFEVQDMEYLEMLVREGVFPSDQRRGPNDAT
jgi:anti-sigma factor RsiW